MEHKELINKIRTAQIMTGEEIVMQGLVEKGLMSINEYEETTGKKYIQERT